MYVMQQNKHWNFKRSSNTSTSFLSPSTLLRSIEFSGVCWVLFATTKKTKTRWTSVCCPHQFGFGSHLLLSSLQKKSFPRNINWVADFRGKRSYSNANPTAMQLNDLCNNSVPACKNINNTHNVCHKFTTHICWHFTVKCLFRETNIIKFEQCILYKYFKSVELSLLYVCVHKQFEWMVKMWCFCFPK